MTENERLKIVRQHFRLTQKSFSQELDIKQGSYSDVERGKAGVSVQLLKNLIKRYRVNPLWLCEGEGQMFFELDSDTAKGKVTNDDVNTIKAEREELKQLLLRKQQSIENIKEIVAFLNNEYNILH
ncbi:MAG: helix-turn-helix transcriptional regulator [Bacteroidales bacterium]|nr:helix-turn-helix transcriptional regulator [Tenuifilaceae bacterium]